MVKIVKASSLEEECQILEQELRDQRRKYWDDYGKQVPGLFTIVPTNPLDVKHPLLKAMPWDHFSPYRLAGGTILYSCLMEGLTLHYVQYSHQNHISYSGTIAGMMKQTLQVEGLNTFRTSFPPLAVHSPLAKTLFIPIFEYLRTKMWRMPYMEKDSIEEESIRTGVSASAASLAVFWLSRAGELHNILNSKFHTITQKMNPLPFGMFSAVPKHGSPYYNTRNNALMYTTRFFLPNMFWWPTYVYTKNYLSQEDIDPYAGAFLTIGASALAASAVTNVVCQPIFLLRDTIGSQTIAKLVSGDREAIKKFRSIETPPFFVTKQLLGRFIVGAPICVIGAYSYELLRGIFLDPIHWDKYSY